MKAPQSSACIASSLLLQSSCRVYSGTVFFFYKRRSCHDLCTVAQLYSHSLPHVPFARAARRAALHCNSSGCQIVALHLHLPGSQSGGMPSTVRISHPHLAHEEHWVHSIVNVHRGHLIFLVSGINEGTVLLAAFCLGECTPRLYFFFKRTSCHDLSTFCFHSFGFSCRCFCLVLDFSLPEASCDAALGHEV